MAIRLEDLLASFRRHLRAAAEAPRTIELYSRSVRYFSRRLTDRGREPVLDEPTQHAVAAWLAELAETCEPSTVGTRLRGMRRFCRWLDSGEAAGSRPHRHQRSAWWVRLVRRRPSRLKRSHGCGICPQTGPPYVSTTTAVPSLRASA